MSTEAPPRPSQTGSLLLGLPLTLFILLPIAALFFSARWPAVCSAVFDTEVRQAVLLSMVSATAAALVGALLGLPVAWLIARKKGRISRLIETIFDLPLVLPPAVAGLGLLLAFGRNGWPGSIFASAGLHIPFTTLAVVLAQIFVAAPVFVKCARSGFALVPDELLESAAVMGASPAQIFRAIALPLAGPAILAGFAASWARALGEFGATLLFAGNLPGRSQTLPLAIYQFMEHDMDAALAVSFILLVLASAVLILLRTFWKESL